MPSGLAEELLVGPCGDLHRLALHPVRLLIRLVRRVREDDQHVEVGLCRAAFVLGGDCAEGFGGRPNG